MKSAHATEDAAVIAVGDNLARVRALGLDVLNEDFSAVPIKGPPRVVSTVSPNSYGMSTRDEEFKDALQGADILVLDGVYFGLAGILLSGERIRINNGPSVFKNLVQRLDTQSGSVFFMGSMDSTLDKIRERMAKEYPNVRVGTFSPPYKPKLSESDNEAIAAAINEFQPDVVFVGMTAPKQEKWAFENRDRLNTGLIVSIGAVFDWFAGNEREVSPIWWKLHLGWLIRTIHRPEILKRYPNVGIFFWHLFLAILRIKRVDK